MLVVEFDPGPPNKTTLMITGDQAKAKYVQKRIVLGASASLDMREAADAIVAAAQSYVASNADLGAIEDQWRKLFLGENLPALTLEDIGAATTSPPVPHPLVGRTITVDLPYFGDSGIALGEREVTISQGEDQDTFILSFSVDGKAEQETVDRVFLDEIARGVAPDATAPAPAPAPPPAAAGLSLGPAPAEQYLRVDISDFTLVQQALGSLAIAGAVSTADMWHIGHVTHPAIVAQGGAAPTPKRKHQLSERVADRIEDGLSAHLQSAGIPSLVVPASLGTAAAVAAYLNPLISGQRVGTQRLHTGPPPPPPPDPFAAFPRVKVIKDKLSKSIAEFTDGMNRILDVAPHLDNPRMRAALRGQQLAEFGELERAFEELGGEATPAALAAASPPNQMGADALLHMYMNLIHKWNAAQRRGGSGSTQPQRSQQPSGSVGNAWSVASNQPVVQHVQVARHDSSGTELEQRERHNIMLAAQAVSCSQSDSSFIANLSVLSATNASQVRVKAAQGSSDIQRLLLSGYEPHKALDSHVAPSLVAAVGDLRGTILREISNSWGGEGFAPTSGQTKQIKHLLAGRHAMLDYHALLGKTGGSTIDDPLKPFKSDPHADKFYPSAVSSETHLWSLCAPEYQVAIVAFQTKRSEIVREAREQEVEWDSISEWDRDVRRKMDQVAEKYATRESLLRRGSPELKWLTDMSFKHNVTLAGKVSQALAIKATREAAEKRQLERDVADKAEQKRLQEEMNSLRKQLKAIDDRAAKRPRIGEGEGGKGKGAKGKGAGGRGNGGGRGGGGAGDPDASDKSWGGRSRKDQQRHLLSSIGMKDGKYPCLFHFTEGRTCTKSAAECKGHHG